MAGDFFCEERLNILFFNAKKGWGGVTSWMVKTTRRLNERGHRVSIISRGESLFTKKVPSDINYIPIKIGMDFNPLLIAKLVRYIRKNRIDVVITNTQKEVYAAGTAARICGVPVLRRLGTDLDLDSSFKSRLCQKFTTHYVIPCRDIYVKVAKKQSTAREMDFTVVYNGRDPENIGDGTIRELRKKWNIPYEAFVIGVTSKLSRTKRVNLIIDVFSMLKDSYPNLYLVIAGSGEASQDLMDQVARLNLKDRVRFTGFTEETMTYDASYDLAVSASVLEGFPNTVVEYMASGTAVVSTDVNGVPELIEHEVNGLLIPPDDSGALYEAVKRMIDDDTLRRRLRDRALDTILARFTEKKMIDDMESLLSKLVERNRS